MTVIKKRVWLVVITILVVCCAYRYYNLNRTVAAQQLQTQSFVLNERVSTPTFDLTTTKITAAFQADEDIYQVDITLKIHKKNPQAAGLSVLPLLWLTPHYQGPNQSITFKTADGVVINRAYWQQYDDATGIVTFTLPKERIDANKQAVSFELLFQQHQHYYKKRLALAKTLFQTD